jgi:hypothetical protein
MKRSFTAYVCASLVLCQRADRDLDVRDPAIDGREVVVVDNAEAATQCRLFVGDDERVANDRHHARVCKERWREEQHTSPKTTTSAAM